MEDEDNFGIHCHFDVHMGGTLDVSVLNNSLHTLRTKLGGDHWLRYDSSASYILPNGGLAGMIWTYVASLVGFGAATLSMAEMASR